ncbi:hypothetical protein BGZ83_007561, partial [Gryganskiella cystojenkinii]
PTNNNPKANQPTSPSSKTLNHVLLQVLQEPVRLRCLDSSSDPSSLDGCLSSCYPECQDDQGTSIGDGHEESHWQPCLPRQHPHV